MSEQKGKSNTILIKQNDTLDLDVASDTKSFQNKKNKRPNSAKRTIISLLILIVILISLLRVPYIGTYIDAFVFEYLTGCAKYLVYIWFIILCFISIFQPKRFKKILSPGWIIGQLLIIIFTSILASLISTIIFENSVWHPIISSDSSYYFILRMRYFHLNYFWPYTNNNLNYVFTDVKDLWFVNTRMEMPLEYLGNRYNIVTTGGIIGEFVIATNYWILIVITLVLICISTIFFFRKSDSKFAVWLRKKAVKSFGGNDEAISTKELIRQKDDIKLDIFRRDKIKNEANKSDVSTPPLSFLIDTSVDNYQYNNLVAGEIKSIITRLIDASKINMKYTSTNIMPLFTEIKFTANSQADINAFLKKGNEICSLSKLKEFNVSFKNNSVIIEYTNQKPSKISIRSILANNSTQTNNFFSIAGIGANGNPLFVDYKMQPSILIVGKKGSGASMLSSCLIISAAYLSSPTLLSFDIIAKEENSVIQNLSTLPHVKSVATVATPNEISALLNQYVDEIKTRKEKLHQSGSKNQTEFNKVCHQLNFKLMKTRILIFNDFDEIIRNDFQYISQIKYILTNCNDVGVKIMFIATHVTGEILNENIYDNIISKFILKLEYENESLQIFDNYRAFQLFGNGDGYFLAQDNKCKTRFQTCYLNQNELNRIVKIISVFYQAKND